MEWIKLSDNPIEKGTDAMFTNSGVNDSTGKFMWSFGFYVGDNKFSPYTTGEPMRATHYLIPSPPVDNIEVKYETVTGE